MKSLTAFLVLLFSVSSAEAQINYSLLVSTFEDTSLIENKVQDLFSDSRVDTYPNIMNRFYSSNDSEKKDDYNIYDRLKTQESVEEGRRFITDNFNFLIKTERRFDVPKEVIVSLLRVETNFGSYTGSYQAVGVFTSIIKFADSQRRVNWARQELEALVVLSERHDINIYDLNSSYAGAFGLPQFMPTSFLRFAEDGNNDGQINLFDPEDAIWNIGKYLNEHGWQENPWESVYDYNHSTKFVDFVMWYAFNALGSVERITLEEFDEMVDVQLSNKIQGDL